MDSTKASPSVMFTGTASEELFDPFVVYKVEFLHDPWIEVGSRDVSYNRSGPLNVLLLPG